MKKLTVEQALERMQEVCQERANAGGYEGIIMGALLRVLHQTLHADEPVQEPETIPIYGTQVRRDPSAPSSGWVSDAFGKVRWVGTVAQDPEQPEQA
jgi:hypothetical protein